MRANNWLVIFLHAVAQVPRLSLVASSITISSITMLVSKYGGNSAVLGTKS